MRNGSAPAGEARGQTRARACAWPCLAEEQVVASSQRNKEPAVLGRALAGDAHEQTAGLNLRARDTVCEPATVQGRVHIVRPVYKKCKLYDTCKRQGDEILAALAAVTRGNTPT
jgi:hypothetical protein